jgi:UDPglucose 6-dehydrogenase
MKIGVCGLGKLGLPLSLVYAKYEHEVVGIDIDAKRIANIKNNVQFCEPFVNEYLERYKQRLSYYTNLDHVKGSDLITIIVATPSLSNGLFDVSRIEKIVKEIRELDKNVLVAISSNVNVGTCDKLHEKYGRIAYCPEFVAQGSIMKGFEDAKFTVIGAYNNEDAGVLHKLWNGIHNKPIFVVKPVEAEIIKLGLNVSYCMGITWANMVGELCEKFSGDSNRILDIMYNDWRNYKKGLGYMGPCFPRDTKCFGAICKKNSIESGLRFIETLDFLNNLTKLRYLDEIIQSGKSKIGFLGISYKPNIPYTDFSQPLEIASLLEKRGYQIFVYDPLAENEAMRVLKSAVFCKTLEDCVRLSDVLFVGTANYKDRVFDKPSINPWV